MDEDEEINSLNHNNCSQSMDEDEEDCTQSTTTTTAAATREATFLSSTSSLEVNESKMKRNMWKCENANTNARNLENNKMALVGK